ncbi:MAG TPA: transglutaminase-like domain-containing protein [Clostridia bacterium]|nr:transglutaminase-like domain-containing protein [Clostridia bacterium]
MDAKKHINDLVNMILASLICFSFIYGKISSLMFDYNAFNLYLIIWGLLILFYITSQNKRTLLISCTAAFITGAAILIYLIATRSLSKVIFEIVSFISWTMNSMHEITPLNSTYRIFTAAIICLLISVFVFIFVVKRFNFLLIAAYGLTFFSLQWYFKYLVSYSSFYLFLFTMLICFLMHIYEKKSSDEANNYINSSGFIAWLTPLCAVILALVLILPSNNNFGESKWLDNMYKVFTNMFNGYKVLEYFSMESSGFNDSSRKLGGKVNLNNKLVLKVDSPRITYLKGSCKEIYTGYSWKNKEKNYELAILNYGVSNTDIYEMIKGISIFDKNNSENTGKYFFNDKVSVKYQKLMTKSIFVTSKYIKLKVSKHGSSKKYLVGNIEKNGIITSKNILDKNFKYSMDVYNPKYSSIDLQNLLKKSKKGFYDDLNAKIDIINNEIKALKQSKKAYNSVLNYTYNLTNKDLNFLITNSINTENGTFPIPPDLTEKISDLDGSYSKIRVQAGNVGPINFDDLSKLRSMAHENSKKYLQLPKSLPDRVKELARSIASSYETDYEKVKAIENYLSNNFQYTLAPRSTPPGRDFTDYFLFDLKEGYCVYYASAMAIMVRSIGLPARYIEGFILPAVPGKEGIYNVTNQQAHAWVEVYLEGFGWIPFEPTSPFVSAFYNNDGKNMFSPSFYSNSKYLDYIKGLKAYNNPEALSSENSGNSLKHHKSGSGFIVFIILFFVSILLSILIFNHLRQKIRTYKLKNLPPKEKVIMLFELYVRMLKFFKLPIEPGETAVDYGKRIDICLLIAKPFCLRSIAEIFTSARYGKNILPTDEESDYVFKFKSHLEKKIMKEFGTIRFFIIRYILGRI